MNTVLVRILNLPQRSRRALAAALLIASVLVFAGLVTQFVNILRAEISDVTLHRELIGQEVLRLQTMETSIENAKRISASLQNSFLQGDSEAVAEASLQSWLSELAQNEAIEVNSISGAEPQEDGALRMIGVKASLTGGYDRIVRLLTAIEIATPRLTVVKGELLASADDMMKEGSIEPRITANVTIMGVPGPDTKRTAEAE